MRSLLGDCCLGVLAAFVIVVVLAILYWPYVLALIVAVALVRWALGYR